MIDIEARIRAHLASLAGVTATFGQRIYMARALPAGYKPEQGPALLGMVRGGGQAFHSELFRPSVQFRAYAANEAAARQAGMALYEALNDTSSREFAYIRMDEGTLPTLLDEPNTHWPYLLSYYTMQVRNL